jgi:hypothetical protein
MGTHNGLCWLLSISVPKKSANDGSTVSFSLQFLHQIGGAKISCMIVYFVILDG